MLKCVDKITKTRKAAGLIFFNELLQSYVYYILLFEVEMEKFEKDGHTIIHGDAIQSLETIPNNSYKNERLKKECKIYKHKLSNEQLSLLEA